MLRTTFKQQQHRDFNTDDLLQLYIFTFIVDLKFTGLKKLDTHEYYLIVLYINMKVLYKELSEVIALTCWRCMEVRLVVFGYLLSVLYNLLSLRNSFDLDVLAWSYVRSLLCVMSDEGCEILNCWQFYLFLYFMRENIGFPFELLNSFINNIHGLTFFEIP